MKEENNSSEVIIHIQAALLEHHEHTQTHTHRHSTLESCARDIDGEESV